jgi:hypothetical protein
MLLTQKEKEDILTALGAYISEHEGIMEDALAVHRMKKLRERMGFTTVANPRPRPPELPDFGSGFTFNDEEAILCRVQVERLHKEPVTWVIKAARRFGVVVPTYLHTNGHPLDIARTIVAMKEEGAIFTGADWLEDILTALEGKAAADEIHRVLSSMYAWVVWTYWRK